MSSRNAYLSEAQRASALSLSRSLGLARELVAGGEKNSAILRSKIENLIHSFPETEVEYISFCRPETLEEIEVIEKKVLLALAVKVGKTRLIDNVLINPGR